MQPNANDENALWEVSLKDILDELKDELNLDISSKSEEAVDLNDFDLADFKLKNVIHFWKLVVYIIRYNIYNIMKMIINREQIIVGDQ